MLYNNTHRVGVQSLALEVKQMGWVLARPSPMGNARQGTQPPSLGFPLTVEPITGGWAVWGAASCQCGWHGAWHTSAHDMLAVLVKFQEPPSLHLSTQLCIWEHPTEKVCG